ncbi:hypothetical protein IV203_021426 [Nitzschia inconspicua]|uniref:Uncharacterized protein n=1 Tax=Nitzschia inconspicua TaxID=303405 RepID=A0A9K3PE78_9STRA|nr:hypothetical protein IV203_021426 [Nitzschia inconspicua]
MTVKRLLTEGTSKKNICRFLWTDLFLVAGCFPTDTMSFTLKPQLIYTPPRTTAHTRRQPYFSSSTTSSSLQSSVAVADFVTKTENATDFPVRDFPVEFKEGDPLEFATTPSTATTSSSTVSESFGTESDVMTATTRTYNPLDVWETHTPTLIQGGSIRTWTFATPLISSVQVHLKTEGRPMNANVELWEGPDNTPQKVAVYVEDGKVRPVVCFLNTPLCQNSVSIRNTAQMEYPMQAVLEPSKLPTGDDDDVELAVKLDRLASARPRLIQGGAVWTVPIPSHTDSVQLLLETQGRPLNARIELLSGPNNVKHVMEVYCEDGKVRPFYSIIQTPGVGNVIRIVNTATVEFPLTAVVEGWDVRIDEDYDERGRNAAGGSGMVADSQDNNPLLRLGGTQKWDANFYKNSLV